MIRRQLHLAAALAAALVACSSSNPTSSPSSATLTVTASAAAALADGASSVLISVDGSTKGPIQVRTNRGFFAGGASTFSAAATPFSVTLYSCDAAASASCAGTAIVQAVDQNLADGAVTVTFMAIGGSSPGGSDAGTGGSDAGTGGGADAGSGGGAADAGVPTYTMAVAASNTSIPADGVATSTITATVQADGSPVQGRTVAFSIAGVPANRLSATTAVTDASGVATVKVTSSSSGGTAAVTATDAADGLTGTVTVSMPVLGQITMAAAQSKQFFSVLGVRFSGFQETSFITFQLTDNVGQPYPAGLAVNFAHEPLNGSYIGQIAACTVANPPNCTATGVTDASGQVSVALNSGRTAGVVAVSASATGGGNAVSFATGNFAVVGAKPSGAHITVDCTPKNVPALTLNDCTYSHYAGPDNQVTCAATFADRFNNVLGVATQVAFYSEAGSFGPPTTTPEFGAKGAGTAIDFLDVTGGTLPWDVAPFGPVATGEFSTKYLDECGNLTHNPRDGLVTIIAIAYGEEGFIDVNGNGTYDVGEPFIDMGEPYIDANDNGVYDLGETFIDLNQDGKYEGPNGKWDANTVIWAETRILYSDYAQLMTVAGNNALSRFWLAGSPPAPTAPTAGTSFSVLGPTTGPSSSTRNLVFMDGNFNRPSHLTTFSVAPEGSGIVSAAFFVEPDDFDTIGISFTQQYCDAPTAPTTCSNVCPTAPCYVVTNVGGCDLATRTTCTGFHYGNYGSVTITGACAKAGSDVVDASATLDGVQTRVSIAGSCAP